METASTVLSAAQGMLSNDFKPVNALCAHVCAFHCYSTDTKRAVESHHFCSMNNGVKGMLQCIIYDSNSPSARLIGIEYIIQADMYERLDPEEQKLWHSHAYEVQSGVLYQPAGNVKSDLPHMEMLLNTYGKTWHTWQVDRGDELPLGAPQLMMAFTGDGQLDPELLTKRDKECGKRTEDCKAARQHLQEPVKIHANANQWQSGRAMQTQLVEQPVSK